MPLQVAQRIRQGYASITSEEYVERLCSSWLLPTWLLCLLRATLSIYAFATLFYVIGHRVSAGNAGLARQSFSYFTVSGYWGLAFYFAFAAVFSASHAVRRKAFLQSWPGWMKYSYSVFYATVTVYPYIVTAVFWAVLAEHAFDSQFDTWTNISQHAMNSGFAFLELALPKSIPHPWINLVPLVGILACYLGLAYLTHETEGIYVYDFLNPANGRGLVAGYCIGILVATIVVFVVVRYLQLARKWLTENKHESMRFAPAREDVEAVELGRADGYGTKVSH